MVQLGYTDVRSKGKGVTLDVNTQMVVLTLKKGLNARPAVIAKAILDAGYTPVTLYKPVVKGKRISIQQIKIGN